MDAVGGELYRSFWHWFWIGQEAAWPASSTFVPEVTNQVKRGNDTSDCRWGFVFVQHITQRERTRLASVLILLLLSSSVTRLGKKCVCLRGEKIFCTLSFRSAVCSASALSVSWRWVRNISSPSHSFHYMLVSVQLRLWYSQSLYHDWFSSYKTVKFSTLSRRGLAGVVMLPMPSRRYGIVSGQLRSRSLPPFCLVSQRREIWTNPVVRDFQAHENLHSRLHQICIGHILRFTRRKDMEVLHKFAQP